MPIHFHSGFPDILFIILYLSITDQIQVFDFAPARTIAELKAYLIKLFHLQSCKIVGLRVPRKQPDNEVKIGQIKGLKTGKVQRIQVVKRTAVGPSVADAKDMEESEKLAEERQKIEEMLAEEERKEQEKRAEEDRQAALRRAEEARLREAERRRIAEERRQQWEQERQQRIHEGGGGSLHTMEQEAIDGAQVGLTLQVQESKEADRTGRLILPQSSLEKMLEAKVPFPITMVIRSRRKKEAEKTDTAGGGVEHDDDEMDDIENRMGLMETEEEDDRKGEEREEEEDHTLVHGSVSEFTAPTSTVYVPQVIMQRIGAVSGDIINLKTVLLPKVDKDDNEDDVHINMCVDGGGGGVVGAESVRFQPEDDVWYSIDEEERKAVLEFELRRHQFLEANSTLQIPYLGKTHALHVRKIVPESAAAVSIMDTDLSTEVMEQSVQNDRTKQEDKEEEEEDTSIIREESGALTVHLNKGEYSFCKFFVEDVSKLYVVEANGHQQQGIDMYISSQTQHPTHQDFQFASQCEERTMVELSDSHPSFAPTTFYVGVRIRDSKDSGKSISLSMKAKARKSSSADAKKG
eukprot:jgi/Bigna1/138495/aug1.45_g13203